MTKYLSAGTIAFTASFLTSTFAHFSLGRAILFGWAASVITTLLWEFADRTYRRYTNMSTLQRGVCPHCLVFGSLLEVTSADPQIRKAHCQACKSDFEITMTPRGLVCERTTP